MAENVTRIVEEMRNATLTLVERETDREGGFLQNHKVLIVVALVVVVAMLVRMVKRKKTLRRDTVFIVGERGAGKTQLLYSLAKGIKADTVPSIKNNATTVKVSERRILNVIDVAGANHTKQEFVQRIGEALAVIQVVDGTNQDAISGVAELLYKLLVSVEYQKAEPPHTIFLNKEDLPSFMGEKMFQKRLEDQMERIKLSRRTMHEEKEGEDDNIRENKARFNVSNYPIKITKGSVSNQQFQPLSELMQQM